MAALSSDDSPVYLRLRGTIAAAILRGDYAAGDQLPSVRALAAEHGANPLTVAKAYQSFQDDGYVEVRRGVGMFVLPGAAERLRIAERDTFVTQPPTTRVRRRCRRSETAACRASTPPAATSGRNG